MPGNSSAEAGGQEYLVAARATGAEGARALQELMSHVKQLQGAQIVQSKGPTTTHLVVRMSVQQADRLKAAFAGRVIIEPNAELKF